MTIRLRKDVVLVSMNIAEFAEVGRRNGMVAKVAEALGEDLRKQQDHQQPNYSRRKPIQYFSPPEGQAHVLRVLCSVLKYFKDLQATSEAEREIQTYVNTLVVTGQADEAVRQFA